MILNISSQKQRVYCVVIAFFFIFFGFDGAMQYLVALYAKENIAYLAFNSQIILYITFLFANIYSSKLIQPLGLKKSMIIGVLLYFLYIFSLLSKNPYLIYPAGALIGIGASLLWVSSRQMITINSPKKELGKYLGMQFSSFMFGTLMGTVVGAFLIDKITFSTLYLIFSGSILLSLPLLLAIKPSSDVLPTVKFDPMYIFKSHIMLLFPIVFAATFLSSQAQNGVNIVILSRFGLSAVGPIAIAFKSTIVLASLGIGALSVRMRQERILFLLVILGLIGTILFLSSFRMLFLGLSVVLMGLFISSAHTQVLSAVRRIVDTADYVFVIGAFQVYQCLGVLTAIVSAKYMDASLSLIPGVIVLILSIPLLWLFKKRFLEIER